MIAWLEIDSPNRCFYSVALPNATLPDLQHDNLISIGQLNQSLETLGEGEAPNQRVTIDNADGAFTSVAADWLHKVARVKFLINNAATTLHTGRITRLQVGQTIDLQIVN